MQCRGSERSGQAEISQIKVIRCLQVCVYVASQGCREILLWLGSLHQRRLNVNPKSAVNGSLPKLCQPAAWLQCRAKPSPGRCCVSIPDSLRMTVLMVITTLCIFSHLCSLQASQSQFCWGGNVCFSQERSHGLKEKWPVFF